MYIIAGKNNVYINSDNGINIVNNIENSTKWNSKEKAENVLVNCCMSTMIKKHDLHVEEFCIDSYLIRNGYIPKLINEVKNLQSITSKLNNRKSYLLEELSKADKKISDILHAAEFYDLNACQGYKLYKMLHEVRKERREIKNELDEINLFQNSSISQKSLDKLEINIFNMQKKRYYPRILNELFEKENKNEKKQCS